MRRCNVKLLFGLVLGTALLVGLTFLVHWLQTGRLARALAAQADRAAQKGDDAEAARYLGRYLELEPDDIEARARFAHALAGDKVAVNSKARARALFALEQVLTKKPDRRDLRLRLVRIALDLQRRDLAREHLTTLTQAGPDGEAEFLWGQLAEAEQQWDRAAQWYRQAVEHAPKQLEGYVRLADLLRRHSPQEQQAARAAEADAVMNQLITRNPENFEALLARWHYHQQPWFDLSDADRLREAGADVERAAALSPDDAGVLLAASDLAQAQKQPEQARTRLLRGRELYPADVRFHRELAWLELRADRRDQAIAGLREGARTLKGDGQSELLWMLANVLIDASQRPDGAADPARAEQARAAIAELARTRALPASVDYLQARLHVLAGRWAEAARLLDRSRELLAGSPEVARQADLLLAQCYDKLNDPQARLAAYTRIVSRDPSSLTGLLGKAKTLAGLGQSDEALVLYEQIARLPGAPAWVFLEIARMTVLRNVQSPSPDWKQAEAAVQTAEKVYAETVEVPAVTAVAEALGLAGPARNPRAVEIPLLRAELLVAQGQQPGLPADKAQAKLREGMQLIERVRDAYPDRIEPWAALVIVTEQRKQSEDALRLLTEAQTRVGDTAGWRALAIDFWARRGGPDAAAKLAALVPGLEKFAPAEQARLWKDLAEAQFRLGNRAEAAAIWERLAGRPENANDLKLRLWLFDAAAQLGDEPAMQRWIDELKRVEGADGAYWQYCAAVKLIRQAGKTGSGDGLDQARKLLDDVAARRPAWPAVLIARADVDALQNHPDQAIVNYRRAVDLGERNPRVIRQLVEQLYKRQRYDDAEKEIRKLQQQAPETDLKRLIVDIALRREDTDRAVSQAFDAVPADSTDYADHLWLGQVLAASAGHGAEAEKHLRRATELGPDKPETWLALVQLLVATDKKEAEAVLGRAAAALPAKDRPLTLALGLEALGKLDDARQQYQQALQARPDDVLVVRSLASFYLRRGQISQAEPLLRQLIDGKFKSSTADQGWARRGLALALANSGDWRRFPDALALVGLKLDAAGAIAEVPGHATDSADDELRARVRVLARQPRRAMRQKAIALLEELGKRQQLPPDEQFLLAQFHETDGAWPKAREVLRNLSVQSKNPAYLTYYAQALLRQKDLAEADRVLAQLEQAEKDRRVEPGTFGAVELRAQFWEAQGQPARALQLLKDHANRPGPNGDRVFAFINALARQQRFPDALKQLEEFRGKAPDERVAAVTMALLRAAQAPEQPCAEFATWLRDRIAAQPRSTLLLLQLAGLEELRGRHAEVEKLYRQVLALDAGNLIALNNLALLLAQQYPDRAAEALTLMDRALDIAGPQPDLLDSRATVYLAQKRADLAIADLERANADRPAPVQYFHLAQAQRLTNNTNAAAALMKKATAAGLKPEQLHPSERAEYRKLLTELESR